MDDKRALRAQLRVAREAFAAARPPLPCPAASFTDRLVPGTIVAAYRPMTGEADPEALIAASRAKGCRLALPHVVDRPTPIRFLEWTEPLVAGPYGLQQPAESSAELTPDIILTPLVAFDRRGNRLGMGAGHYDRAFAAHPHAWRIGVAWSIQGVAALTPDPWDVPLHAIATELEWIVP